MRLSEDSKMFPLWFFKVLQVLVIPAGYSIRSYFGRKTNTTEGKSFCLQVAILDGEFGCGGHVFIVVVAASRFLLELENAVNELRQKRSLSLWLSLHHCRCCHHALRHWMMLMIHHRIDYINQRFLVHGPTPLQHLNLTTTTTATTTYCCCRSSG